MSQNSLDMAAASQINEMPTSETLSWNLNLIDLRRMEIDFKTIIENQKKRPDCDLVECELVSYESVKSFLLEKSCILDDFDLIWSMCDLKNLGLITCEQYIIVMWLIEQKSLGLELPHSLLEIELPERFQDPLHCHETLPLKFVDECDENEKPINKENNIEFLNFVNEEKNVQGDQSSCQDIAVEMPLNTSIHCDFLHEYSNNHENITAIENSIIDLLKSFQNLIENFREIMTLYRQYILEDKEYRKLKLSNIEQKIANLQEKLSYNTVETERIKNELNYKNDESQINNDTEVYQERHALSWNPFVQPIEELNISDLNQNQNQSFNQNKSTNPFLDDYDCSPCTYGPAIEMDTECWPLLSPEQYLTNLEIAYGLSESNADFNSPNQSFASEISECETLKNTHDHQDSFEDNFEDYIHLFDSSTDFFCVE